MGTRVEVLGHAGVRLVGDALGDRDAQPVVLLHGGGQTRHAWGGAQAALARAGFYALAMDARGHGDSQWAPDGDYLLASFAADLLAIARSLPRPPAVVGASLGGLTALLAQATEADALAAVVLVDVAPRMEPEGVARIIGFMMERATEGFATLEDAADAIAAYLPHRPRPKDLSGLAKNLRLGDDGRYRWHWDPKFIFRSEPGDPHMMRQRLEDAARSLRVPTLLVRGGMSDVLSDEAAAEFRALAPDAEYVDVAGAAHMIAGDKNDAFNDAVVEFLNRRLA